MLWKLLLARSPWRLNGALATSKPHDEIDTVFVLSAQQPSCALLPVLIFMRDNWRSSKFNDFHNECRFVRDLAGKTSHLV